MGKLYFDSPVKYVLGVGEKKAKALLKHFKTLKAVRAASVEELCGAEGISHKLAQAVFDYYHAEDGE